MTRRPTSKPNVVSSGPALRIALGLLLGLGAAAQANSLPTITAIADQSIAKNASTPAIAFSIGDLETPATDLSLLATTDNTYLVPIANIVFGGSGASRTVMIHPAANRRGVALIRIRVVDAGGASSSRLFTLIVNPIGDYPTITAIPNQTLNEDGTSAAIPFTVGDAVTPAGSLSLVATTDNPTLIPLANIVFSGSGASRTVRLTPAVNKSGTARVRVRVNDGDGGTNSTLFTLTVAGAPAARTFQIPDASNPGSSVPLVLVQIPAGSFQMGSGEDANEQPVHPVTIGQSFYLGKFEVTQEQWRAAVHGSATINAEPSYFTQANGYSVDPTRPVELVSWDMIKAPDGFLVRLNAATLSQRGDLVFRLPSEAEWEYACRATSTGTYWWGENYDLCTNYEWIWENSNMQTHGTSDLRSPNVFGLYNMVGNVLEWCEDDAHVGYGEIAGSPRPDDGSPWVNSPRDFGRVLRGSAYNGYGFDYRSAWRGYQYDYNEAELYTGLRVVLAPKP